MSRLRRLVAPALMALGVLAVQGVQPTSALQCASRDSVCQALQQAQSSAAGTKGKIRVVQSQVNASDQKEVALEAQIGTLDSKISTEEAAIASTERQLAVLQGQISVAKADLGRRQSELQRREQLYGARIRQLAKGGTTDYLTLFFSASSFTQLVTRVMDAVSIIQADRRYVNQIREERDQVQQLSDRLQAEDAQQASLLATEQADRLALLSSRRDLQAALAAQKQIAAELEHQAEVLQQQQAIITHRVAELQAEYSAEARAAGGGNGQFIWPEAGNPPITQGFGCTDLWIEPYWPSCPSHHFHTGIDIAGPYGAAIYASDAGVASAFWGWGGGYGNFIIITHGNGYSSLYGHLSSIVVRTGQVVQRGQLIGYEGTTGFSTGPHVHFEIRYNGAYQNPCLYIGC